jgi:ATP-dependent helicase/DNAse subunit B
VSELKKVLSGIRAAHDLVAEAGDRLAWADFRAELEMVINNTQITPPGGLSRLGRVLATDVLEMRGLPHDHLFLLGLSEGLFPEHLPEEVLYAERERQSLEADGIDLQTLVERADDASLFYQAIGQARQSLTISRFYVDDQGAPCPPSPYWNAVRAAVELDDSQVERVKVGAAPGLHEAAALNEAAVAVAAILSSERSQSGVFAAHNMLLEHPEWGDRWRNVLRGRAIEARREDSRSPFDHTSGVLTQPDLVAITAQALGPDHIWSASQLNDYGLCPFRFFARRLLRLEELQEPAEGLDMLQRGLLNHAILEHTYRQIGQEKWAISPENRDRALAILDDVAQSNFESAPRRFGFRPSPIWDHECAEMLRQLRWLVQLDFSEANPFRLSAGQRADKHPLAALIQDAERRPFWLEAEFGMQGDFALDGPAGPVRVRGVIDRMDRAGDRVAVIDYKTGATKHPVEDMRAGRDFQMVLYLLAAQEQVRQESPGLQVAGGLFWHIANRTVSGEVLASDETLAEALAHLHEFILAARVGWFVVQPRQWVQGQCAGYCEFRTLCRMTRGYLHKPG